MRSYCGAEHSGRGALPALRSSSRTPKSEFRIHSELRIPNSEFLKWLYRDGLEFGRRGCLNLRAGHLDLAVEHGAVGHRDARRLDVPLHRPARAQLELVLHGDVPRQVTEHDDGLGNDFSGDAGALA